MFSLTRLTVLMVMIAISGIFAGITMGIAQTSPVVEPEPPIDTEAPAVPERPLSERPASEHPLSEPPAFDGEPQAAGPKSPVIDLEMPAFVPPLSPVEPASPVPKTILEALDGKAPQGETGDIVWDEMMEVIRKRGSVLDGSSLDLSAPVDGESPGSTDSQRAFAAELLLRTSRTLEQIDLVDNTRQELIEEMRDEAAKLLLK